MEPNLKRNYLNCVKLRGERMGRETSQTPSASMERICSRRELQNLSRKGNSEKRPKGKWTMGGVEK